MQVGCLIAVFVLFIGVNAGDECLHCNSVTHPEYCRTVERCQDGESCYIDEHDFGGHNTYSLGCRRQEVCDGNNTVYHHSPSDVRKCSHCCHGKLCNAVGCNQTAYHHDRGPICYSCSVMSHPDDCNRIAICGRDEACLLSTNPSFGRTSYSASCGMKTICRALNANSPATIGRRNIKHVRHALCTKCCAGDLCNDGCSTVDQHPHCHPNPCAHGSCMPTSQGYDCTCHIGYTGKDCDIDVDECVHHSTCDHGSCINTIGGFVCTCDHGYTGLYCNETNSDPCQPNPCLHGLCYAHSDGGHRCECHKGYAGSQCDLDIDECVFSANCEHGLCENTPGGYNCHCNQGYAGPRCNIALVNPCHSNPCAYGQCSHAGGNYTCTCQAGYTGLHCDQVALLVSTNSQSQFPTTTISSSATTSDSCKDLTASSWCENFKNSCYHQTVAYYCPHTCHVPGCPGTTASSPTTMLSTTGSCADTVENCAFMHTLQSDFCLASFDYAKIHCRKYCRFC